MSFATAIAQIVSIIEGTPVADDVPFVLDKSGDPSRRRRFSLNVVGGAQVVPKNEGRHVVDVDVVLSFEPQRSASANRHQRMVDVVTDTQAVTDRLLTGSLWGRPSSGIHRLTVEGREAIAYSIEEGDAETPHIVRFSFPLEHT